MDQLKPNAANSCPLTPITFLGRAASVYSDCTSIVYNTTTYTWSRTHNRCLKVASFIASQGIKRGDVVSVVAPNVPAMYELHFAVPMAGAVLNTINTRLDARTISVLLGHSEAKLVFVDYQLQPLVTEAISMFPSNIVSPMLVLVNDDDAFASAAAGFHCTYQEIVDKASDSISAKFEWLRPENEWDPLVLNYTSGTTAAPKGVVHCHRAMFVASVDVLLNWSVAKQPVYLWTLPMFHANGWSFTWGMAAVGGTNVCLNNFDGGVIHAAIRRHNVTHMCAAPVVLNMLAGHPNAKPIENPVHILTGGAPPQAKVLLRTESLGFTVSHAYGMTEVAGVPVSCAWKLKWNRFPATERARFKARQGVRTIAMTEVDVVDAESGVSVKRDGLTMGEIVFRGGCLMLGYFKDPEETSKCMRENGWFYTGDVGVMHPDGYLEIKDRSKDIIISGGENISSVEVETVLYSHPAVEEAAVVARPDEKWGETPCAFLTLKAGLVETPKEKEIIDFARDRLPHFMVPKTAVFMKELPRTATGKIKKPSLREIAKALCCVSTSRM